MKKRIRLQQVFLASVCAGWFFLIVYIVVLESVKFISAYRLGRPLELYRLEEEAVLLLVGISIIVPCITSIGQKRLERNVQDMEEEGENL